MSKTWTDKLYAITEAARKRNFGDGIDEIDTLGYTDKNGRKWEDRFDYIDTTTIPITVVFIGGTGHKAPRIPIGLLTQESIDTLYNAISH